MQGNWRMATIHAPILIAEDNCFTFTANNEADRSTNTKDAICAIFRNSVRSFSESLFASESIGLNMLTETAAIETNGNARTSI